MTKARIIFSSKERLQCPKRGNFTSGRNAQRGYLPFRKLQHQAEGRIILRPQRLSSRNRPPIHPFQRLPSTRGNAQGVHLPNPSTAKLGRQRHNSHERLSRRHQQVHRNVHSGGWTCPGAEPPLFWNRSRGELSKQNWPP